MLEMMENLRTKAQKETTEPLLEPPNLVKENTNANLKTISKN